MKIDYIQQDRKCRLCEKRANELKEVQNKARLGVKGDPLGTAQEIKIWPYYKMVHEQIGIRPKEWDFWVLKYKRMI